MTEKKDPKQMQGYKVIDKNDKKRWERPQAEVIIFQTEVLEPEARLACALIERWGIVAGELDGEDSAGRAKLRRMTSKELVDVACETAYLACQAFRERGWVLKMPTIDEAEALLAKPSEDGPPAQA